MHSDLEDKTERTICKTTCVECGKQVDWPSVHLIYPLCPDCDCAETLPPSTPNLEAIQPASIITLIPDSR